MKDADLRAMEQVPDLEGQKEKNKQDPTLRLSQILQSVLPFAIK